MTAAAFGSQQLRIFRRAMRDHGDIARAAEEAGMSIGEAKLHAADDAKFPPPPEAFDLIGHQPQQKEAEMGRPKKDAIPKIDAAAGEGSGINGEYSRPDAAKAFDIYDKQIAPKLTHMSTLKGDLSQPYDDIKQHANFPRSVLNFIVKLEGEEDAKRDHMLLALADGLRHRQLFLPRDLVTMANGEDGDDVIPTGDREGGGLATLLDDDADVDDAESGSDEFDEASEEELAAQTHRGDLTSKRASQPTSAATAH